MSKSFLAVEILQSTRIMMSRPVARSDDKSMYYIYIELHCCHIYTQSFFTVYRDLSEKTTCAAATVPSRVEQAAAYDDEALAVLQN